MIIFVLIGVLVAGGTYLVQQRSMVQVVFGLALLSHAANFVLLSAGVAAWRGEPLADRTAAVDAADPLPQAFVLTAIVITMAVTIFMLATAVVGHNDDTHRMPETGEGHDR
ncbi:cation:proton antiporter subunit C [Janibacter sp. YIM B02568]|uniref:sodium:proton antiporter n=1 Tax=Janibacter endophyticus TaxID=2806261 RepID=UPI00195043F5|nr:cation:proton antiporter subunit C [Janibacter endophyticus]MBM6547229.1 cation:proton antiporter subunit C [Janibacter endophyticus]